MPYLIQKHEDSFCLHKKEEDGSMGEMVEGGCHATQGEAEAHMQALYAHVGETTADSTNGITDPELTELIAETGLHTRMSKEGRPTIPFAPGINPEELKGENGERPTFVELKIAEVGTVSEQKYLYDDALVDAIHEQIMSKRPGAVWGHPKPEDASTSFPDPVAFWVGAARQGNTLWGKAWIRETTAAKRVQDTKRVGGSLTTSIWGRGKKMLKDAVIQIRDFNLERIDFAPMERAAAPMDGQFEIVYQMSGADGEITVTIEELKAALAEHKPEVILNILPVETMERVNEMVAQKNRVLTNAGDQELITQMAAENEQARTLITEMQAADKVQKEQIAKLSNDLLQHDLDATVRKATDWVVTNDSHKNRLNALRSHLKMGLVAEMQAEEPLWDAMLRVMDNNNYKLIVEMTKKEIGGGALTMQVIDQRSAEFVRPSDEQISDARGRLGI